MVLSFLPLALAALLFVGGHFGLSSALVRDRLVGRVGERWFRAGFAVYAAACLIWMVLAYAATPQVVLWSEPAWSRWLALLGMPVALILVVGGARPDNPTASSWSPGINQPEVDGIFAITRHPMMWGIGLFAIMHIPANGNLASLILFGSLTVLAWGGTMAIDARKRRLSPALWGWLAPATSNLPLFALVTGRTHLRPFRLATPAAIAFLAFVALLALHRLVLGVSPFPY